MRFSPTELENAGFLLRRVNPFWLSYFSQRQELAELMRGVVLRWRSSVEGLRGLLQSFSVSSLPYQRLDLWYPFEWEESQLELYPAAVYDGTYAHQGEILYDQEDFWALPANERVPVLLSSRPEAAQTLLLGADYGKFGDKLVFRENPFAFFSDGIFYAGTRKHLRLWGYLSVRPAGGPSAYGRILGLGDLPASETSTALVNSAMAGLRHTLTWDILGSLASAFWGCPYLSEEEVVEFTLDGEHKVISNEGVYQFPADVTLPEPAERLGPGHLYGLRWLRTPEQWTEVPAISLDRRFLKLPLSGPLTFPNSPVVTQISWDGGRCLLSFEIGGAEQDVQLFWEEVRRRESETGVTLAALLSGVPEPAPEDIPPVVVPAMVLLLCWESRLVGLLLDWKRLAPIENPPRFFSLLRRIASPGSCFLPLIRLEVEEGDDTVVGDFARSCQGATIEDIDEAAEHETLSIRG